MNYKDIAHVVGRNNETITNAQRESAYAEGELAFQEGKWRICNPYTASSPTLEQVWINGWDHGRRIKKSGNPLAGDGTWSNGKL